MGVDDDSAAGRIRAVLSHFDADATLVESRLLRDGLIHDSHAIRATTCSGDENCYILQRINETVFPSPERLMHKIEQVLTYLHATYPEDRDSSWRRVQLVYSDQGASWIRQDGSAWRMYRSIDGARTLLRIETEAEAREIGGAFSRFLFELRELPGDIALDTLPGYRDTARYYAALQHAVSTDPCGRRSTAEAIVAGYAMIADLQHTLSQRVQVEGLPTRPLHGDTKFNNVLFDAACRRAICVIDLDTVLSGPVAADFGDCYRAILLESADGVRRHDDGLDLFRAMTAGFAENLGGTLEPAEIDSLVDGVQVMVFETGVRFLTDYLQGDMYFRTSHPGDNLARAIRHLEVLEWIDDRAASMRDHVRAAFAS